MRQAVVCPNGFNGWKISFINEGTKYRVEYKTQAGAVRQARKMGCEVTVDEMKGTKIVTNLMSGRLVRLEKSTPLCCDPSSETYWSM